MKVEEIRELAKPLNNTRAISVYNTSLDEFVADGCVTIKYRSALLEYAAMKERCKEIRATLEANRNYYASLGFSSPLVAANNDEISMLNYIENGEER